LLSSFEVLVPSLQEHAALKFWSLLDKGFVDGERKNDVRQKPGAQPQPLNPLKPNPEPEISGPQPFNFP
jgi:hypothetical protein